MGFRVIIAGSRDFNNFELLTKACDKLLKKYEAKHGRLEIISGGARGADQLGERYAELRNYRVMQMPADWDKHGQAAGYLRNQDMAKQANACVVFYNGISSGAKHMIDIARKSKLPLAVINVQPQA